MAKGGGQIRSRFLALSQRLETQVTLLLIGLAAFAMTFSGAMVALRFRDKFHLITGFSAGAILAVALADLLPEAIDLRDRQEVFFTLLLVLSGYLVYFLFDGLFGGHAHDEDQSEDVQAGSLAAGSLSLHSFLDGAIIGLGFQVSSSVGAIVTSAVLVHDFSDGINTTALIVRSGGTSRRAIRWALVDAIAPGLGIAMTLVYRIPREGLGIILALFCGFFLYIGASHLIPENFHSHSPWPTRITTLLGAATLCLVIWIVR